MAFDDPRELIADLLRQAARATVRYASLSEGFEHLASAEDEFNHGDDALEADKQAHAVFEKTAAQHPAFNLLRIRAVVGEERILRSFPDLKFGDRVIVLDPIDGTAPWVIARTGFCTAALCLVWESTGRWEIDGAVIATPTGCFTLIGTRELRYGPLGSEAARDGKVTSVLPENPAIARSIAAVCYKPKDRELAQPLLTFLPTWSHITLGGNPFFPWVVTGALTAAITIKWSSTWDAVGILMAAATDAVVGDHEGTVVSGDTFRGLFAQVLLTGNVTPIPPMIVAKNMEAFEIVAAAATESWEARRHLLEG
jgi:fructose-1,6-bisphosphatase/inositol monophosphatase family enzyme